MIRAGSLRGWPWPWRPREVFAAAVLTCVWLTMLAAANAGEISSPASAADISAVVRWLDLPDSPLLQSRVQAEVNSAGQIEVTLTTRGPGVELVVVGRVPTDRVEGSWKITRGELDLAVWERFVASRFAATTLPADLVASGAVQLSGAGTWRAGVFVGTVTADLKNGRIESSAQSWLLDGVELHSVLELKADVVELRESQITARSVQLASVAGRNLAISVLGREGGQWSVENAKVETLGGSVAVEPFAFFPAKPALDLTIGLNTLDLRELADLVPQALTRAGGHLSGRVGLRWSPESGVTPKQGSLRLNATEGATLQLANAPGFLSSRVPTKINLVPTWLGPVAKMVAQDNPAYVALREIESGDVPLKVEKLEIDLYPDGPDAARSAQVNVIASPARGSAVKTVRFNVTVLGPLEEVLKLGLDNRVDLSVKSGK